MIYASVDSLNNDYRNAIIKSTDSGETWTKLFIASDASFSTNNDESLIYLLNNDNGKQLLLYSKDNFVSWQKVLETNYLLSANIIDMNKIFICYKDSTYISCSTDYGITWFNNSITSITEQKKLSNNYSLSQNYPNPFNPSTTIKYSIPVETGYIPSLRQVSLKVYDILGREVATLVNEEKAPGNYEVKFDGSNFSSGVYFYRLQTGSFSETKKIVLMK